MTQFLAYNTTSQEIIFALLDPVTRNYLDSNDLTVQDVLDDIRIGKHGGNSTAAAGTLQVDDTDKTWFYYPTAGETSGRLLRIAIIDTNATKRWVDEKLMCVTHGNAQAMIEKALDTAWGAETISAVTNPVSIVDQGIGSSTIMAGAITPAALADGLITSTKIAVDAIRALHIEANAFTSAKFATDAISAGALSQAAADKVWTTTVRALTAGVDVTKIDGVTLAAQILSRLYSGGIVFDTIPSNWSDGVTGTHGISSPDVDAYKNGGMVFLTGANAGHTARPVLSSTATELTVKEAWINIPQSGDTFVLIGRSVV